MRFKTSMLFVAIMASFSTSAQTGDPMSLGSYPVENLVVRVPTGMTIHYQNLGQEYAIRIWPVA